MKISFLFVFIFSCLSHSKQIAFSFDDIPVRSTEHYESLERTKAYIQKFKELNMPASMIFANPCRTVSSISGVEQIALYKQAGQIIANHSCSHPKIENIGVEAYTKNISEADLLLSNLMPAQKFYRFPFLNEGKTMEDREHLRDFLRKNNYRNALVSIDTDDYYISQRMNDAKKLNKKIDYKKLEKITVDHLMGAANFYEDLAVKTLGYSPKHVILLHEVDTTLMFLDAFVKELRKQGWTIISAEEAYTDKMYSEQPKNLYANDGIIAQLYYEKTGEKKAFKNQKYLIETLNQVLDLKE